MPAPVELLISAAKPTPAVWAITGLIVGTLGVLVRHVLKRGSWRLATIRIDARGVGSRSVGSRDHRVPRRSQHDTRSILLNLDQSIK
jgi:hypothetical protein